MNAFAFYFLVSKISFQSEWRHFLALKSWWGAGDVDGDGEGRTSGPARGASEIGSLTTQPVWVFCQFGGGSEAWCACLLFLLSLKVSRLPGGDRSSLFLFLQRLFTRFCPYVYSSHRLMHVIEPKNSHGLWSTRACITTTAGSRENLGGIIILMRVSPVYVCVLRSRAASMSDINFR